MLHGMEAPVKASSLTLAVCEKMAALLNRYLPAGDRVDASAKMGDWQDAVASTLLFLGWGEGETLVAIGCVNICYTLTDGRVARVEEVVVDEAVRDEAMEREVLRQITSWVEERVDAITVDDRVRLVTPRALKAEGFLKGLGAHCWWRPVPVPASSDASR